MKRWRHGLLSLTVAFHFVLAIAALQISRDEAFGTSAQIGFGILVGQFILPAVFTAFEPAYWLVRIPA